MKALRVAICERLNIKDFHFVEIESKKRILPEIVKDLRNYLMNKKKVDYVKSTFFFDQFLDTPSMDLFKKGASLRLRYKRNGSKVYMQYKGPGFHDHGLLYRSEFSSEHLRHFLLEESHHDVIHFSNTSVKNIMKRHLSRQMRVAMIAHVGESVLARISQGPIIAIYQKDKFSVDLGPAFLEPSLDHVFAFHINNNGLHPLSTFWEYENEIKASARSLNAKLAHIPDLLEFDERLVKRFRLKPEPLDKYHRCTSIFLAKP